MDWPATSEADARDAPSRNALERLAQTWSDRLERYPGWFVAPMRNRETLFHQLEAEDDLCDQFVKLAARRSVPNATAITLANILTWSLAIALARPSPPLLEAIVDTIVDVLGPLIDPDISTRAGNEAAKGGAVVLDDLCRTLLKRRLPGMRAIEAAPPENEWIEAAGTILRAGSEPNGRETQDAVASLLPALRTVERELRLSDEHDRERARRLRSALWIVGEDAALREIPTHGAIIEALSRLDFRGASWFVERWPRQPHDAASNLGLAGYRREIGQIVESFRQIAAFVEDLRSLGTERRRGIAEASRKAWAFYVYRDLLERNVDQLRPIIEDRASALTVEEIIGELDERLNELESRRCDPRREVDRLVRELNAADDRARFQRLLVKTQANYGVPVVNEDGLSKGAAITFLMMCEQIGFPINHVQRGVRLAVVAARLLAHDAPQIALTLILRAGTPEDVPFDGPDGSGPDATWDILFFDQARTQDVFKFLSEIFERLITPEWFHGHIEILKSRLAIVEHLLCGLIIRNNRNDEAGMDLARRGFDLACSLTASPLIVAYRAWSSHPHSLYYAALSNCAFIESQAASILLTLLDIAIPNASYDDVFRVWADPMQALAAVWYPVPNRDGTGGGPPANRIRFLQGPERSSSRCCETASTTTADAPSKDIACNGAISSLDRVERTTDHPSRSSFTAASSWSRRS